MTDILQYLKEQSDDQFKRQIQYILDQLNSNTDLDGENKEEAQSLNANEGEEGDDDEDEDDEEEDEEDEMFGAEEAEFNDTIEDPNVLVGEDLLTNEFLESEEEGKRQMMMINELMERDQKQRSANTRNHSGIGGQIPG